jgi:CrcB protein
MTILAVAAGGALGAVARYLLAVRLYNTFGIGFPWGTLGVNVLGSLLLGVVLGLVEERGAFTPEQRSFLTIGFLGGMTTFSTFIYEGWQFTREGDMLRAAAYAALSLVAAFVAFSAGHAGVRILES